MTKLYRFIYERHPHYAYLDEIHKAEMLAEEKDNKYIISETETVEKNQVGWLINGYMMYLQEDNEELFLEALINKLRENILFHQRHLTTLTERQVILKEKLLQLKEIQHVNPQLTLAITIATLAHKGQKDKGGNPYILHPQAVADMVETDTLKAIAYLHDVVEDADVTIEELTDMGVNARITIAVRILTKSKDMSYEDYLKTVKRNADARLVKIADLKHNMQISRIPNPTNEDFKRIEKYREALNFLES